MSDACSLSAQKRFGTRRICKYSGTPRSSFYYKPERTPVELKAKPGPKVKVSDAEILSHVQRLLAACPFLGEGYRKLHARLRFDSVVIGKDRLLRILRENDLLAQVPSGKLHGPRHHTGVIATAKPNEMWGTDLTFTMTEEDGLVPVFIAVDHFNTECVGIHAALRANRFEALEVIKQGVTEKFGSIEKGKAMGLKLRHDHGTQYVSYHFQREIQWCGIESSPSFIRQPEGNGIAERFIKTLKEQLLWISRFKNVEELRQALHAFKKKYNEQWLLGRHNHQTPKQVYENYLAGKAAA